MSEITFTKDEVQKMLIEAFNKGEIWGVTYSSWFIPTEEEKVSRATKDCEEIYKSALNDKL